MAAPEHPLVRHSRREAVTFFALWLATMLYTSVYCFTFGQGRTLDNLTFVWGVPDWIFWGIFVPWFVCLGLSTGFAFWWIRDDQITDDGDTEEDFT